MAIRRTVRVLLMALILVSLSAADTMARTPLEQTPDLSGEASLQIAPTIEPHHHEYTPRTIGVSHDTTPGPTNETDPQAPTSHTLYLRGDHDGQGSYRNFTTQPSGDGTTHHVEPCIVHQEGRAKWCWQMDRAPEPWTLKAGTQPEAVIRLSHLDRSPLGTVDPQDPANTGQLRLDVVLTRGTIHEAARGSAHIQAPLLSGEDTALVKVPLHVEEDTHWNTTPGDAPAVELQIHLSGLIRRDEPPLVTTGALEMESYLVLPGFPVHAFQDWEETQRTHEACNERLIAQQGCTPHTPNDENDRSVAEAPLFAGPLLVILLALITHAYRSRRCNRETGRDD